MDDAEIPAPPPAQEQITETRESAEAFQPDAEFDPTDSFVVAAGYGPLVDPLHKPSGVRTVYTDPRQKAYDLKTREEVTDAIDDLHQLPPESKPSLRIRQLLDFREFSRTGVLPPNIDQFGPHATHSADPRGTVLNDAKKFYDRYYANHRDDKSSLSTGCTVVKMDGWTLLALGIDIISPGRGMFTFAVQGDRPYGEMLARARTAYPQVFEHADKHLTPEARVLDVPPLNGRSVSPS